MAEPTGSRRSLASPRLLGAILLVGGLLVNPITLGALFAPDGSLDGEARIRLVILLETFSILLGVTLLWPRLWTALRTVTGHAVFAIGVIVVVSLAGVGTWWGITAYRGAHHHT